MEHVRQIRPDSGLGFKVKVLEMFSVVPSSLLKRALHDQAGPSVVLRRALHRFLSQFTHRLILESQLPHITVNLIFQSVLANDKSMILRGS